MPTGPEKRKRVEDKKSQRYDINRKRLKMERLLRFIIRKG